MKKINYILVLALLTMVSCTSRLYTGAEFDDLYYLPSDKPVEKVNPSISEQVADGSVKQQDYYDNIYATDTLVADDYADAVDINSSVADNNYNSGGYDYYDNFSYTGRLRNFYGNYFDPYWRDPFYSGWGYPSFGYDFGYGGFPYSYRYSNPYLWDSYYSYGMYGGYYGGFYPGFYGGGYYGGGYYGGLYGGYGYYPLYGYGGGFYVNEGRNSVAYGRRERPSNLSSNWNNNMSPQGSARRDGSISSNSGINRRTSSGASGNQPFASDQKRTNSSNVISRQAVNPSDKRYSQDVPSRNTNVRTATPSQRNSPNMKPEYNSTGRSYTPSYNNPRMSTRPSYNNSRVSEGANYGFNRNNGNVINNSRTNTNSGTRSRSDQGSYQNPYNNSRINSSGSGGSYQRRSASPSGNSAPAVQYRESAPRGSGSYSVPTRSSVDRSSSYSSGSSYSSSSSGRSSYSSGSSGSSYSSGSSSGGSSSSGSSSGGGSSSSSSGGSRR